VSFLNPAALWGLTLLAIPIIIHLFQFRRYKTIWFSDTRFLEAVQRQTKNRQKLLHYLILALRLLAVAAAVLVFAQPIIDNNRTSVPEGSPIYIYLDNSPSMETQTDQGERFNNARQKIASVIALYGNYQPYKLITNTKVNPARDWLDGQSINQELAAMAPDGPPVPLATILENIRRDASLHSGLKRVFIFSDFQESALQKELPDADSSLIITLTPMGNGQHLPNLSIDSIWFESPIFRPGFEQTLQVALTNHGTQAVLDVPLRLQLNGVDRAILRVDLPGLATTPIRLNFTPSETGFVKGELTIEDPAVPFDNIFQFALTVSDRKRAVHLYSSSPNDVLTKILKDTLVDYQVFSYKAFNPEALAAADLVVLDELPEIPSGLAASIGTLLDQGKNALLIPGADIQLASYNAFLNLVGAGNLEAPIRDSVQATRLLDGDDYFSGVFSKKNDKLLLPATGFWYPIGRSGRQTGRPLLELANGRPLVFRYNLPGQLVLFASPLSGGYSNLKSHPLLLPLVYQGVVYLNTQRPPALALGSPMSYPLSLDQYDAQKPIELVHTITGKRTIPPLQRYGKTLALFPGEVVQTPGFFEVQYDGEQVSLLAFNTHPSESRTTFLTGAQLQERFAEKGWPEVLSLEGSKREWSAHLQAKERGRQLWAYFLIFALICLLAESFILRKSGN
jgi:hypothetical protein